MMLIRKSVWLVMFALIAPALLLLACGGSGNPLAPLLCDVQTLFGVTDPLASQQWGLRNNGQTGFADTAGVCNGGGLLGTDINVNPVYTKYGISGSGVTVAVVDSGLEIAHEDLSANVVAGGSWNFNNSTTDPTSTATTGDHGTSVSGLIAMAKNGIGGVGVAYNAKLKGFNYISSNQSAGFAVAALGGSSASPKSNDVMVFNQSFGRSDTSDVLMDATVEAQYASGTSTLRGGKGALYVKSAGNGFKSFGFDPNTGVEIDGCKLTGGAQSVGISCQNANFDPSNTIPYNIVMAALNSQGVKSSYSTAGAAVWASTPGGEYGYNSAVTANLISVAYDPAMVTTDQSGCASGYSVTTATSSLFNQGGATNVGGLNTSCNYANTMNGTSSAAPMMSGSIALILEANPALTWREVKDILARTAVKVDGGNSGVTVALSNGSYVAEQGWVTNAAGFKFHNWYGFGAVNVSAAVEMAKTYTSGSLATFANTGWVTSGTLALAIPDNSITGVTTTLTSPKVGTSGIVETVQLKVTTVSIASGWEGDIGIELTSPSGTKSILKNIKDGLTGSGMTNMVLASNAFYGEPNTGTWTVKVVDGWSGSTERLTNVQIRVYGH